LFYKSVVGKVDEAAEYAVAGVEKLERLLSLVLGKQAWSCRIYRHLIINSMFFALA